MIIVLLLIVFVPYLIMLVSANIIYFLVVLPDLRRSGQSGSPKFAPSDQYEQLEAYKKLSIEKKLPMVYSYFFNIFKEVTPILVIIFLVLAIVHEAGFMK